MKQPQLVHLSDWASQPNVRIACTQEYGTPSWFSRPEGGLPKDVHLLDNGKLYTFDFEPVTCPLCKETDTWKERQLRRRRYETQLRVWGITEAEYVEATKKDPLNHPYKSTDPAELDRIWKAHRSGS